MCPIICTMPLIISIHALLAESDRVESFYSKTRFYFYPRSPCGERHEAMPGIGHIRYFYPRSPCGERLYECWMAPNRPLFLSTLSLRRATDVRSSCFGRITFLSTLSLRRATLKPPIKPHRQEHFYPRSPCGERLGNVVAGSRTLRFLSTLSLRRATLAFQAARNRQRNFYPRSPCGERRPRWIECRHPRNFYPRSPCGERL